MRVGEKTRQAVTKIVLTALEKDYDILQIAASSYGIPAVEEGEETAIKIVISVPKGSCRNGGKEWDVYEEALKYQEKLERKGSYEETLYRVVRPSKGYATIQS